MCKKQILKYFNDTIILIQKSSFLYYVICLLNLSYRYLRVIPNWRVRYIVGLAQDSNPLMKIKRIGTPSIDVIIPVSAKDIQTLEIAVHSVRMNIVNPISKITIVYSDGVDLKSMENLNCYLVHESELIDPLLRDAIVGCWDKSRRGWVTQQVIKLQGVLNSKNLELLC